MRISSSSKMLREIVEKWRKRKKGHFVVYTKEGKRFVVPIEYLNHPVFRVLLEMAEEEFGSSVDGPLQVPCEEEFMDYILSLLRKTPPQEVETVLASIPTYGRAKVSTHNQGKEEAIVKAG
ncbi:Small auxin-up RNA [Dillenia turbinata]|uniref:Small auxin-up RNA n=1 Tax=Dillenia turbinata TaxID=194707 RepID=A0AAN8ZFQ7_9MAGN